MTTGKRGGISKGFHCLKVILILHVQLKCSLKKHYLFFTTTFRVLVFWLFWVRERGRKITKIPEMKCWQFWHISEGKHSYKKEGNNVVNLQLEGKDRECWHSLHCARSNSIELHTLFMWKHTVTHSCQERERGHLKTWSLILQEPVNTEASPCPSCTGQNVF